MNSWELQSQLAAVKGASASYQAALDVVSSEVRAIETALKDAPVLIEFAHPCGEGMAIEWAFVERRHRRLLFRRNAERRPLIDAPAEDRIIARLHLPAFLDGLAKAIDAETAQIRKRLEGEG